MSENKIDFYDKTCLKSYNLNETMRYQLGMLDTLDAFTRKHSENVATIVCRLCENLKLNTKFTVYCTTCAYIHDIGKLFIPPSILQKKGPLTDEEYEIMKTHTTIGYKMCMGDEKLRPFAAGPKFHHEGLDGSGYPEGLKDKDIPLEGKIIRVADEYDAITSKRQYKTHVGISDTLKFIIGETKPNAESVAIANLAIESKEGKVSPIIVKALMKVVIEDIEYEISGVIEYLKYVKKQLNRLKQINTYFEKMKKSKKEKDKQYYLEGIRLLLEVDETVDNFQTIINDYMNDYATKEDTVNKLFNEIKIIKKLKV